MWWFLFFLFFPFLPASAEQDSKNTLKGCKQCTCVKEDPLIRMNWKFLRVTPSIIVLLSHNPLSEKEAQRQEARDRELNHGVNNHFKKNYDRYEAWAKTLPMTDYSAFCTKELFCRRSRAIELDWDLTDISIEERFYPVTVTENLYDLYRQDAYKKYYESLDKISDIMKDAKDRLRLVYGRCCKKHRCLQSVRDQGLMCHHAGDYNQSLQYMIEYAELAKELDAQTPLAQKDYLQHSETLLFALEYDKAVDLLTEAIQKYPDNKELYEKRIFAYLELGRLNDAVKDFVTNDFDKELRSDPAKAALALAFLKGASRGVFEGVKEYPLSMLYSLRGAGQMLWATVSDPMGVPAAMMEDIENAVSILREGDVSKVLEKIAPELHDVIVHWENMDHTLKWEKLGHIFGKYSFEVLCGMGNRRLIEIFQRIRTKNALCNVKASITSVEKKIEATAAELAAKRKAYFESTKIQWDKQGKHIEGHNSWKNLPEKDRISYSLLTHKDPERLLKQYAGKGTPYKERPSPPWEVGYKEDVNFREVIGIWKSQDGTISKETTWGRIHHDTKGGSHIVPGMPKEE